MQCAQCDSEIAEQIAKRTARDEAERVYVRLRESGLPADYRVGARLLGHLPMSAAQTVICCQMLGNGLRGLYLHGPAGSYKTSVSAWYLAAQIRGGGVGKYVFVPDLMSDIHATYKADDGDTRASLIDLCVGTPMLVLDDLGKEKASEHGAGVIFEILDGRYRAHAKDRWMIATSNYDLDSLCDRFPQDTADPIRRRLAELTVAIQMERA